MLWITDRTGRTTLGMLRRYERDVRQWRELGETLTPLESARPELAAAFTATERGSIPLPRVPLATRIPNHPAKLRRRDSNSNKRNQNPLSCH